VHHVVLDEWARRTSWFHQRDARIKILVLIVFLVSLAGAPHHEPQYRLWAYAILPLAGLWAGRLPLAGVIFRAASVLPVAAAVALGSLAAGDVSRACALVTKSFVSALAVLVAMGSTPMPQVVAGLESLGAPRFLLWVLQFLHRYLFVISEQAQHMRLAALSRGAAGGPRFSHARMRAAAGAIAVLFARSHHRGESIYRAMISRGYSGKLHMGEPRKLNRGDYLLMVMGLTATMGLRFGLVLLPW